MPISVASWWDSILHPGERVPAIQEPGGLDYIHSVAKAFQPEVIVEFGTQAGGVTIALHEACPEADLYSFDQYNAPSDYPVVTTNSEWWPTLRSLYGPTVRFLAEDILTENSVIRAALSTGKRTLLYCDNGRKIRETRIWGALLESGDLLGVHDWDEEIRQADIAELSFKLLPHRQGECEGRYILSRFWEKK